MILLLEYGADVNAHDGNLTALHLTARDGDKSTVVLIQPADAMLLMKERTALHLGSNGHADVVKLLIQNGADGMRDRMERDGFTSAPEGRLREVLIQNGADVNAFRNPPHGQSFRGSYTRKCRGCEIVDSERCRRACC